MGPYKVTYYRMRDGQHRARVEWGVVGTTVATVRPEHVIYVGPFDDRQQLHLAVATRLDIIEGKLDGFKSKPLC